MPANKRGVFFRDSVFRFSAPPHVYEAPSEPSAEPGAMSHKASVRLTEGEINWLDCRCCELRQGGWRSASRSTFIRALVRAMSDKELPLAAVFSEEELVVVLSRVVEGV